MTCRRSWAARSTFIFTGAFQTLLLDRRCPEDAERIGNGTDLIIHHGGRRVDLELTPERAGRSPLREPQVGERHG